MKNPKSNFRIFMDVAAAILILCLLLVTTWHLSAGNAHKANRADEYSKEYQNNTRERIALECTNPDLIKIQECVNEIVKANRDSERSEDDLTAQERMADWAFWMLIITIFMFAATVAGVVFVWRTLIETKKIGQAQVRAYLSSKEAQYEITEDLIQINIIIDNHGFTPAKFISVDMKVGTRNISPWINFRKIKVSMIEAGNKGIAMKRIPNTDEDYAFLKSTIKEIDIDCTINWVDVFDRKETAHFIFGESAGIYVEKAKPLPKNKKTIFRKRLTGYQDTSKASIAMIT